MKSELPESWFSNPRPLPLDERGRVDFSRDKRMVNTQPVQPNPTTAERFIGRMFHAVSLPDRGRIIQLYRWDESDRDLPLATANHNVFRLDAAGKVVWQVRRDDKGHMNWDYLNREARAEDPGCEGYFDPFNQLYLLDCSAPEAAEGESCFWQPGCRVYLNTRWWAYLLDIDTGIATCTGEQLK